MKAAVCDDNVIFLEEMKRELCEKQEIEEIHTFSEIEEFFTAISEGEKYDVIFLDIDWGEVKTTGLEFGERLYEVLPHVPVILMTGYNDRFSQQLLLAKMNLVGYLVKPINSELLAKYLAKVRANVKKVAHINIFCQGKTIHLETDSIRHIESHNHKIHIYTENEVFEVYEKNSEILKRLPEEFIQCHKSYLVNLNYVASLDGKEVVMKDGNHIPISRTFLTQTKEQFFDYIGKMI